MALANAWAQLADSGGRAAAHCLRIWQRLNWERARWVLPLTIGWAAFGLCFLAPNAPVTPADKLPQQALVVQFHLADDSTTPPAKIQRTFDERTQTIDIDLQDPTTLVGVELRGVTVSWSGTDSREWTCFIDRQAAPATIKRTESMPEGLTVWHRSAADAGTTVLKTLSESNDEPFNRSAATGVSQTATFTGRETDIAYGVSCGSDLKRVAQSSATVDILPADVVVDASGPSGSVPGLFVEEQISLSYRSDWTLQNSNRQHLGPNSSDPYDQLYSTNLPSQIGATGLNYTFTDLSQQRFNDYLLGFGTLVAGAALGALLQYVADRLSAQAVRAPAEHEPAKKAVARERIRRARRGRGPTRR